MASWTLLLRAIPSCKGCDAGFHSGLISLHQECNEIFSWLIFMENDALIRSDSLVGLCGAVTLLCRVTQFPGCAVQNLRGRCGDNLWWDQQAFCSASPTPCAIFYPDGGWCCMVFLCYIWLVHLRSKPRCVAKQFYAVQEPLRRCLPHPG